MSILYPYQQPASAQLIRALKHGEAEYGYPGAVDLSDTGTGKSFQTLNAMLEIGRKVIVLCPKVGEEGWKRTFKAFNAEPVYIGSYESAKGGWRQSIVSRYGDHFQWHNAGQIGIILDEAQHCKGQDTIASYCIDGAIRQNIPIICASATLASSPVELRIAGMVTGLHKGGNDWLRFMAEYGCRYAEDEQHWIWNRKPHLLQQLHHILIPQRGCRVTSSMMGERPGSTIRLLPIQCAEGPEIQREWQDALKQLDRMASQNYPRPMLVNMRRAIRMRLWKRSEEILVPHVAELMRQDLEKGCSVIAFFGFTSSREQMGRTLKTRAGFYGGQNSSQRAFYEKEFQADRIRVLLNQIKAGGASVSLHDLNGDHPRVSYVFPSDSGISMAQAPGRTDRAGMLTESRVFIPFISGGLTEAIVKAASKKILSMSSLNNG